MGSLRTAVATGFRYQFGLKGATVVLNQIATIVLARLLMPEDFGLVGVALVFLSFLTGVADFGIGTALIQGGGHTEGDDETGATLRMLLASVTSAAAIVLGPLAAWLYDDPRLLWLLWALTPLLYLNFLGLVPRVRLARELRFRKAFAPDAVGRITGSVAAMASAFAGLSYWSLVIGPILGSVVGVALLYVTHPWKFRFRLDRPIARRLLSFGGSVLVSNLLLAAFATIGLLVLGAISFQEVGYFSVAYAWAVSAPLSFSHSLDNVMFPVYAATAGQPDRVRRAYSVAFRHVVWILVPVGVLLSASSGHLVSVLLGDAWLPTAESLGPLALGGWLLVIAFSYQSFAYGSGRPGDALRVSALACGLMLVAGPVGVLMGRAVGLSFAFLMTGIILVLYTTAKASATSAVDGRAARATWVPPLISGGAAYVAVSLAAGRLSPDLGSLAVLWTTGIAVYSATMQAITRGRFLPELRRALRALSGSASS